MVVTFGGQRVYLTRYHTALFGKLWVPDRWESMTDLDRYVLLRHERVHLRQRKRMGDVLMAFVYLVPFFPLFLAYGRARIEWEAYIETIRATAEVYGRAAAESLRPRDHRAVRRRRLWLDVAVPPDHLAMVRRGDAKRWLTGRSTVICARAARR